MSFFEGTLHHVIMCHGVIIEKDAFNCTLFDFDDTMLVNVRSIMHLTSLSVPYLKHCNPIYERPSITILTSHQGSFPDPESPLMSISASMVQMMIKNVAIETASFGIRINGVAPGVTKTAARTTEPIIGSSGGMGLSYPENRKFLTEA
jgi:NAD(P)-dependent dehydrogenase (short-subunit alcohol dehydrogenase family)